jgi:glucokinase
MAESTAKTDHLVGVDFGGTKLYAGVFSDKLDCIGTARKSTKPQRGVDSVIKRIASVVEEAVDEADLSLKQIRGVGIGAPGAVDGEAGNIIFAPNLPGWKDVALKKALEKELGVPVFVENDCNICMLGVYGLELKSKPRNAIGIFIGTGIGGGIILNGELFSGFNHTAGEIGHMILETGGPKCGCGNKGCFEALASRTAIFRRLQQAVKDGQKTVLTEMLGEDLEDMRSGNLRKALRKGDKLAEKVIEEAAEYIGIGVANLANILAPEVIVLGGGVIEALADEMLAIIIETANDYAMPGVLNGVEIFPSKLGDEAGITGGAVLAKRMAK